MISRSLFTENKKLRVFDFDDSLVKTNSFIYITNSKTGKNRKLSPAEYAVYKPKADDEFDYSDFEQVKEPQEMKRLTTVLKRMIKINRGKGIYILTARSKYKPIVKYIRDIGINSNSVYVVALASNNPKDKSNWIEAKIDEEGYDDVYFADDSIKNVEVVKRMLRSKDIKFRVQHIKEHKL